MRFHFVESIEEFAPGCRALGRITVPVRPELPACLIAEAIGQLAGWIAMERAKFTLRPVAGLVGECKIAERPEPGAPINLSVELDHCDEDGVSYSGAASVNGREIVTLEGCGAPMLPLEDFDNPSEMAKRFGQLTAAGGVKLTFDGELGENLTLEKIHAGDQGIRATITTPADPAFYLDHFPRRPVYPASLLLDAQIRLAALMHGERIAPASRLRVTNLKLRSFIQPGTELELAADLRSSTSTSREFALSTLCDGRGIASAGLVFECH